MVVSACTRPAHKNQHSKIVDTCRGGMHEHPCMKFSNDKNEKIPSNTPNNGRNKTLNEKRRKNRRVRSSFHFGSAEL